MDSLLDPVRKFIEQQYQLGIAIRNNNDDIDIKKIQQRQAVLDGIKSTAMELYRILKVTGENIEMLESMHNSDINTLTKLVPGLKISSSVDKIPVKPEPEPEPEPAPEPIVDKIQEEQWHEVSKPRKNSKLPGTKTITITDGYSLDAVVVDDWVDVKSVVPGQLYYITSSKHFAIEIANVLIHGNIGKIYTNERDPIKIKNCRYGPGCNKPGCDYYHNPKYTHGTDCRNFIATSWNYAPVSPSFKTKRKSRRFGSIDNISTDIAELDTEEGERFFDQTMHGVLCMLILAKYRSFEH